MRQQDEAQNSPRNDPALRDNTISTRMKLILLAETKDRGRFSFMEVNSNVPAATWRTWWTRGGAPNGVLLEAVAKLWPHYAYWLITGKTDIRCGHTAPSMASILATHGYFENWPEESSMPNDEIKNGYSKEYLKLTHEIDGVDRSDVSFAIKMASLQMITGRRRQEISENFEVKLEYERFR